MAALFLMPPVASLASSDELLRVYVSIEPLRYLVERVGGRDVRVDSLVRSGQEPETYEPTLRQVAGLSEADVFFGAGLPLEAVWHRQLPETSGDGPVWIDLSRGLDRDAGGPAKASSTPGARDPHVWLSPANAQRMATVVAATLADLRPGRADRFRAKAEELRNDLQSLDREISRTLNASGVKSFMVFHPAWGYFARDYGLRQIAIESEGKEPGPKALTRIIETARAEGIHTVFVDPSHSSRLAATVASSIGGETRTLDPLAYDYIDNLLDVARAIAAPGS